MVQAAHLRNGNDTTVLRSVYGSRLRDVFRQGLVVSHGGFGGPALAVHCGGSGDVTETRRIWHVPRTPARIGTAVIYEA